MAVEEFFPFDAGPGTNPSEAGWGRMARLWREPGVVGSPTSGAYNLTVSGLNATISRRPGPVAAEAWVDGFMHRLVDADVTFAVPANTNANPRVDRIVLRRDLNANTIVLTRLTGTPAASPAAPALTQIDGGVYDLPLWRFTVPGGSGTPLTGLVDDRKWIDPNPAELLARKLAGTSRASTVTATADPELTISPVPVGTYALSGAIHCYESSSGSGGGLKIGLTGSATFTAATAWGPGVAAVSDSQGIAAGGLGISPGSILSPNGIVTVTAAGSLTVVWAQNSSTSFPTVLDAGTWIRLTKLT